MNRRIRDLEARLATFEEAHESAVVNGDLAAIRDANDRIRNAEAVLDRLRTRRLTRPVYVLAGVVIIVGSVLALWPVSRPSINLTAKASAVRVETASVLSELIRTSAPLQSLQLGDEEWTSCEKTCDQTRIDLERIRSHAGSVLQFRVDSRCLSFDVVSGFVDIEVAILKPGGWDSESRRLAAGGALRACGLTSTLLIPSRTLLVADLRGAKQDGSMTPSLIDGSLNLADLNVSRSLSPGSVVLLGDLEGYTTVDIGDELLLRASGAASRVEVGSSISMNDARPSLLKALMKAPRVLEGFSLFGGVLVLILGLRGRLKRLNDVLSGGL